MALDFALAVGLAFAFAFAKIVLDTIFGFYQNSATQNSGRSQKQTLWIRKMVSRYCCGGRSVIDFSV